ncbi:MAG: type II secretion system minor pseudopilin GspK [Deltaproteobacteria bacterium]|nr:type II secretion system minor pseudopilin GspK [Deltaproteobacteria bacterium]
MTHFIKNKNGTALVITLFVIAALTTLAVAFSHDTGIELNLTEYSRDSRFAHQLACSGANLAIALLDQDENRDVDNLDETWAQFNEETIPWKLEEDSSLKGRISDENSKLDLNKLIDKDVEKFKENVKRLQRLFSALGIEKSQADPIVDWLDEDDVEEFDGAEDLYYQSLDTPYNCANGPFITIRQVYMVKGIADIIKNLEKEGKNLFDYITIYGDGYININTASVEVLQSLHEDIDEDLAQSIVEFRKDIPYTQKEELKDVTGIEELFDDIDELITVNSNRFSISMESVYRTSKSNVTAIVERNNEDVKLIYWQAK